MSHLESTKVESSHISLRDTDKKKEIERFGAQSSHI